RTAALHVQPMGPDLEAHAGWAREARGGRVVRLRRSLGAERLILAVDPLDFTKGVLERLDAVAHFFDRYPSYRGRVVFCQIAIPSRTRVESYREMKRMVDQRVAEINHRFANPSWQPCRYLYRSMAPGDLAVYYCAAAIALVTALRDGLAQTALEYVA